MPNLNTTIINQKADQCVKCGLCLPHCPTYRLFQDENESPRGRIALIQAYANEQLQPTLKLQQHLEHCLGCRNCERVCPSGIDYSYLLDQTRYSLGTQSSVRGLSLAYNKNAQRYLQTLLYWYQKSGLQRLTRFSGILKLLRIQHLDKLLPNIAIHQTFNSRYPAHGKTKGKLGLFTGCTGHLFDQTTLQKTIGLLQKIGYEIVIPQQQTCCGALHQHRGQTATAHSLARQNIQAFDGLDTIIYIASGCGAQLHEYESLLGLDHPAGQQATSFSNNIKEITSFLVREDLTSLQFKPLNKKVAIHTPCSMRNVLRGTDETWALLSHIPEIQLQALPENTGCCGAAGSYMITQPKLASAIRRETIEAIDLLDSDIVSTINIGCGLHLSAGMASKIRYTHPVNLLVNQVIS